jgi:hypothetical protein
MYPALSGTAVAAYRWSDHGQNYNSTHRCGARHVSCGYALAYRVPLALVLHYLESFMLPYPADRLTTDPPVLILQQDIELPIPKTRIALRQHMGTLPTRAVPSCLAAGVWYCSAGTARDTLAAHSHRRFAPHTLLCGVGQLSLPVFSQHILQYPVIQGQFPDETLQLRVLPVERLETLRLRDLHIPKLPSPPIQGLFRNIMLATDVANVSRCLRIV